MVSATVGNQARELLAAIRAAGLRGDEEWRETRRELIDLIREAREPGYTGSVQEERDLIHLKWLVKDVERGYL